MNLFLELLQRGVVVADGGMGSLIAAHFYHDPPARAARRIVEANREHPDLIEDIHRRYIQAGARLLETNSFSLNRTKLAALGLEKEVAALNGAAVKLARNARDDRLDVAIGGSIGPLDPDYLLQHAPSDAEVRGLFHEQAVALEERGVDLFVLETFAVAEELLLAVQAVRDVSALPLVASFTIDETGFLAGGVTPESIAAQLAALDVAVIGINCSVGPHDTLEALARVASVVPERRLGVQPNAGFAQRVGGRVLYPSPSAAYFADFARQAVALGARLVGGCCGTTPQHIRAIADAVSALSVPADAPRAVVEVREPELPAAPAPPPSRFATMLAKKEFVVSVQLDPPKLPEVNGTVETVSTLKASGLVHLVDINSKSGNTVYQDALVMAMGIQSVGLEAMPHITPRDATVYGLSSQLVAACAWGGLRTVLVVTGDAPTGGAYPETGGILHVDSIGLVRGIAQLGLPLTIGVAFNQNAESFAEEMGRLEKKLAAGASFVMTQPIFSSGAWEHVEQEIVRRFDVPVLVGVWPLVSYAQAVRLNERVPGVVVDAETLDVLRAAGPHARNAGFARAHEMVQTLRGACAGVYVIAPFKRPREALEVLMDQPAGVRAG
jgi:homocysteine S-methyltransferase